jgi:hypothetical protein
MMQFLLSVHIKVPQKIFKVSLPGFLLSVLLLLLAGRPAMAEEVFSESEASYTFGGPVAFRVKAAMDDDPIQQAQIFFRSQGDQRTLSGEAKLEDTSLVFVYDQADQPLRPFARIDYWFQVSYASGKQATSEIYSFMYDDNRYDWQVLTRQPFQVHWYSGDLSFAQNVLDVAFEGLKKAQGILPVTLPEEMHIYVYSSSEELQATRRTARRERVAGHAEVDLGVAVVSLPNLPESRLEAERQVPHELMHILLYRTVERGYENIPTWLNEGLASLAELYPSPDYRVVLDNAAAQNGQNRLLPMGSLCHGFPPETSNFILAYAQSDSFTRYLYRTYGGQRLELLVRNYADGMGCEQGFEASFGSSLTSVETSWLAELSAVPGNSRAELTSPELWPWFLLLFVVIALPLFIALPLIFKPRRSNKAGAGRGAMGD